MTDETPNWLDRRTFLRASAATGAAALTAGAGAVGAQTSGSFDVPHPNQRHTGATAVDPTAVQFNPTNTTTQPAISQHLLFEPFAVYNYETASYEPAGLADWTITPGEEVRLSLREDLTWSDGTPVTARDVVTQLEIARKDGDAMFDWAGDIQAPDDYTVVVSIETSVNPSLIEEYLFGDRFIQQPHARYGQYLDQDVSNVREFADTDPITNGPFQYESRNAERLLTTRFPDSPYASTVNFGEYAFEFTSSNSQRQQSLIDLSVDSDYSLTVPGDVVANFPDAVEEVQIPDVFGMGLAPNFDDQYAGDRAIRQAIQHVMDRTKAVENSLPRVKQAPEFPTGIATDYQSDWLDGVASEFDTYGYETSQTSEATAVLQDAGYSKQNGTWEDADGNAVSIEITHPTGWSDWSLGLESAVSDLNDFGFDASLNGTGNYFNNITNRDSFQFLANTWLHGGPDAHPYYSLLHQLHEPQLHNCYTAYPGYREYYGGSEAAITLDSPTPNDGETEVDVAAKLDELATTADERRETELVQDLAFVANQDLPRIPIKEKQLQQWLTTDDWVVPEPAQDDPDANVQWAPTWLPRQGKLNYGQGDTATTPTPTPEFAVDVESDLTVAERGTIVVSVENLQNGLGTADFEVSIPADVSASLVDASLASDLLGSATVNDAGTTVTVSASDDTGAIQSDADAATLVRIGVAPTGIDRVPVTVTPTGDGLTDDAVTSYGLGSASESFAIQATTLSPLNGTIPRDVDGDGVHEDLNGNGQFDADDVVTYFQNIDQPAIQDHPDAYDANGNGKVDFDDIVQLFGQL